MARLARFRAFVTSSKASPSLWESRAFDGARFLKFPNRPNYDAEKVEM